MKANNETDEDVPKTTKSEEYDLTDNPQMDPDNADNDPTGDDTEANDADGNGGYPDEFEALKDKEE